MSDVQWQYLVGREKKGPVSTASLQALVDAGVVTSETLVYNDSLPDWEKAYKHIPGMAPPAPGRSQYSLPHTNSQRSTDYAPNVGMFQATGDYFRGYVNFSSRSSRSQYWWPIIPLFLLGLVSILLDYAFVDMTLQTTPFNAILSLATILPSLAVGVRRLHDVNRSGWWLFIALVPLIGIILLIVWFCTKGDATENRFG